MSKRNYEIDRLRGVGILVVVLCHFVRVYFPSDTTSSSVFATLIIDLFAIISGYLIASIIVEKIDEFKADKIKLVLFMKSYLIRRIYRIYPVALVAFLLVLICSFVSNDTTYFPTPADTLEAAVYLITYTFNYYFTIVPHSEALASFWSLAFEEQFYIIFPLFILLTKNNRQRVIILLGLLFVVIFIARPITMYYFPIRGLFFTQTRIDSVIYGCLIYHLTRQPWYEAMKISSTGNPVLRSSIMLILIIVLGSMTSLSFSINTALTIGNLLACAIVLPAVFNRNVFVFPPLLHKIFTALGMRVYSWYIVHFPLFLLTREFWDHSNYSDMVSLKAYSILAWVLTAIAAEIMYRLVEKPSIERGVAVSVQVMKGAPPKNTDIHINPGILKKENNDFA